MPMPYKHYNTGCHTGDVVTEATSAHFDGLHEGLGHKVTLPIAVRTKTEVAGQDAPAEGKLDDDDGDVIMEATSSYDVAGALRQLPMRQN